MPLLEITINRQTVHFNKMSGIKIRQLVSSSLNLMKEKAISYLVSDPVYPHCHSNPLNLIEPVSF
jgi:hypothetical protein